MNTEGFVIADKVWEKVSPHVPGKATDCGVTAADDRVFWKPFCGGSERGLRGATDKDIYR